MAHPLRAAGLLLAAATLITGCAVAPAGNPPSTPAAVRTTTIAPATIAGAVNYSGNVESRSKVSVLPKVAGEIVSMKVDVGSTVKQGEVIAELDHTSLDAQVAQAKAGVAAAQAQLETLEAGSRPETVAEAKANLEAAQKALAVMQSGGRSETISAAEGGLDTAKAKLASLENGSTPAIDQAKANLKAAQARLQQLKDGPTDQQIAAAKLAVEQAKDAAFAADVQKDAACNPTSPGAICKAGQAAADAAQTGVSQAEAQLKVLTTPPSAAQLNQAQAAVDAAKAQLQLAEHPGSASDISAAKGAVQSAEAQLALAKSPYTSADLAKAQAAVAVAQQQLKLAEAPYTKDQIDAAKAGVQQAEAALKVATTARDNAIIKAPINGIVSQKLLSVGSMAAPTTPIITLIDPAVDVVVNVDAAHADDIHLNEPATITSSDFPGKSIAGKVTTIAPSIDPASRTLMVKVTPDNASSFLKDGMLVQVALVTATHKGVIVVPSAAIVQRNGQPTVYVVANGIATPQVVKTGLTDQTRTEITQGLKVGQVIVISGQDGLSSTQPVTIQK